ncbi:formimidoylglutamate deiminase [Pilimelia terevasa]|uniref:formimidoylglutamate deiminase n=1 Tax=Pilimelia terevasa TaxID=53372 RepID=UPI00166A8FC3|nr:formimidoylglutamate deiminase [Pilimelia terevasa]
MGATAYVAPYAHLPGGLARDVLVEVAAGRITAVTPGATPPPGAVRLDGVVLPGLANAHSHAFHRALRGRTAHVGGDFWSWRTAMYAVAADLDPDRYLRLATAVYAEMALAGITCVGEFHYLHDDPDGRPYGAPGAMGDALVEAARRVGIRITLLDTLYLTAGVDGAPLTGVQRRFRGGGLDGWRQRAAAPAPAHARRAAAVHSVRAVPAALLPEVAAAVPGGPLHVHLSEQPAENEACLAAHGRTPAALLDAHGLLGPDTTAVHATHLTPADVALLGASRTGVCLCPTTERELADGIGPGRALADAGATLSLGSDSHTVLDLFAEARGVEEHERLATGRRGHFDPAALLAAATAGHAACGWPDAGAIAAGRRADLVAVRLDSPRTAGVDPAAILAAATAADVTATVCDGRLLDRAGLSAALAAQWTGGTA